LGTGQSNTCKSEMRCRRCWPASSLQPFGGCFKPTIAQRFHPSSLLERVNSSHWKKPWNLLRRLDRAHQCIKLCYIRRFAFPDHDYSPATLLKSFDLLCVALGVGFEFPKPEVSSSLWCCCESAQGMTVPEAAMHKNYCLPPG
jgi:hypothetical protein